MKMSSLIPLELSCTIIRDLNNWSSVTQTGVIIPVLCWCIIHYPSQLQMQQSVFLLFWIASLFRGVLLIFRQVFVHILVFNFSVGFACTHLDLLLDLTVESVATSLGTDNSCATWIPSSFNCNQTGRTLVVLSINWDTFTVRYVSQNVCVQQEKSAQGFFLLHAADDFFLFDKWYLFERFVHCVEDIAGLSLFSNIQNRG